MKIPNKERNTIIKQRMSVEVLVLSLLPGAEIGTECVGGGADEG